MRKSKKNITKRHKTTKKNKCVYTDEAKRLIKVIKYLKKHKSTRKNKTT
jgi:hypothetical protein